MTTQTRATMHPMQISADAIEPGDLLVLSEGLLAAVEMRIAPKDDDRVLVFVNGWRFPLAIDRDGQPVSIYRGS